ncbi:HEAT repeat domain-containing protein [bacterium]|nr:HEAT repeat domain-containing protein [bacterium]
MRTAIITLLAAAVGCAGLRAETPAALSTALGSPQAAVRLQAVRDLALDYPQESLPLMRQAAAADTDPLVRERAVQALALSGGHGCEAALDSALSDPVWFVRWRAVQGLKTVGARGLSERAAAELAADESWQVRVSLYELAGDILTGTLHAAAAESRPESPWRGVLLGGLKDSDERVRLAAATALAANHDPAAFEPLTALLKDGALFTRDAAAVALGVLGDRRAAPALLTALTDPRNEFSDEGRDWARWGAAKALATLSGKDFGLDAAAWRKWM